MTDTAGCRPQVPSTITAEPFHRGSMTGQPSRYVDTMSETASTSLPVRSVHDYEKAARDLQAGRFGQFPSVADGESAARLTTARVDEFRDRLNELIHEFFAPEAAEWTSPVKYGFRWVLMPVDTAPPDDPRVADTQERIARDR